jgi:hypothetical protein
MNEVDSIRLEEFRPLFLYIPFGEISGKYTEKKEQAI